MNDGSSGKMIVISSLIINFRIVVYNMLCLGISNKKGCNFQPVRQRHGLQLQGTVILLNNAFKIYNDREIKLLLRHES